MSENPKYKDNLIVKLSFDFALEIIAYTEILEKNKKYVLSNQILKIGTSIGANIKEAQNAESKNDFIHKLKIALKEVDETEYWLLLCKHAKDYPSTDKLLEQLISISKVLTKIVATSKKQII